MRQSLKILASLALASVCTRGGAKVPDPDAARYENIPERNVFGLKAAEQPVVRAQVPELPKLILTGITTILGNKRALMKEQPPAAKGAEKEQSLILTEGQREGDVEVLQIDENAGRVKVMNSGTVMMLTFEKDGAKLPPATPSPAAPAALPAVTSSVPAAAATPGWGRPGVGWGTPRTRGARGQAGWRGLSPQVSLGATPPASGLAPSAPGTGSSGPLPPPVPEPAPAISPDLTPEEQAIVLELQRALSQNRPAPIPAPAPGSAAVGTTPGNTAIPVPSATGRGSGQLLPQ